MANEESKGLVELDELAEVLFDSSQTDPTAGRWHGLGEPAKSLFRKEAEIILSRFAVTYKHVPQQASALRERVIAKCAEACRELTYGMSARTKRLPDVADFKVVIARFLAAQGKDGGNNG